MADDSEQLEHFSTTFLEMFKGVDLVQASARYRQLKKNIQRLTVEYMTKGYPREAASSNPRVAPPPISREAPLPVSRVAPPSISREAPPSGPQEAPPSSPKDSSDFADFSEAVPTAYESFALRFLTNEFPELDEDFTVSKLKEFNSHLYPTFHHIFKKYFLRDCVFHPEDEEGVYIYHLDDTDVKDNCTADSPPQELEEEQAQAERAYPQLTVELAHISKKRDSYLVKIDAIKKRIDKRYEILSAYFEQKRRTPEKEVPHPLMMCPICESHYLDEEFCHCKRGHCVCQECLRGEIVSNSMSKGTIKTKCVLAQCDMDYRREEIKRALGNKRFEQFDKMTVAIGVKVTKDNPNFLHCPFCTFVSYNPTRPSTFTCKKCGKTSCLICLMEVRKHPGGKCPKQEEKNKQGLLFRQDMIEQQEKEKKEKKERQDAKAREGLATARAMVEKNEEEKKKKLEEAKRLAIEEAERQRLAKIQAQLEQAERDKKHKEELELDLRNYVKKKMDESIICVCPGCNTRMTKTKGCNHIKCPKCVVNFCYQCRKKIPVKANTDDEVHAACKIHYNKKAGGCDQFADQEVLNAEFKRQAKIAAEETWRKAHSNDPLAINIPLTLKGE